MLADANVASGSITSQVSSLLCNFTNPHIYFSPYKTFCHQSKPTLTQVASSESVNQTGALKLKMLMSACLRDHIENSNMLML